jgi:cob(I)alamin adenosyltransferase
MKIYTKTGDGGTTALFKGLRVKKSNRIVEALGAMDELNAWIGMIDLPLEDIQKGLQAIASTIAGYKSSKDLNVKKLEIEIDKIQKRLPELHGFVLPKGPIHVARAVCRRAERRIIFLKNKKIIQYLNRLSDYLFVLALDDQAKK